MRAGWDTALDYQTDLIRSFTTREGRRYLDSFADSLTDSGMVDPVTGERFGASPDSSHALVNSAAMMLSHSDPMFVSAELAEVINFAADSPSYRPTPLAETDMLVPTGFAYFEKPLAVVDTHGRQMYHRAAQWSLTGSNKTVETPRDFSVISAPRENVVPHGLLLAMYAHRDDPDYYFEQGGLRMAKVGGSDLTMAHVTTFAFRDDRLPQMTDPSLIALFKHVSVFFRLCQQTIAVSHRQRVARPVWKRAATWRQIKEVTVFKLRRAKHQREYEGDREVEWTHRWMVGAHWHTYHTKNGPQQQWIAPYVKGPDDKPLILKKRAFELVR